MSLKNNKNFNEYLINISDDVLLSYYEDVELTHFPLLVLEEFERRFTPKKKRKILDGLRNKVKSISIREYELTKVAKKSSDIGRKLGSDATKKLTKSLEEAAMRFNPTPKVNLELIEKLGQLRDTDLITSREFQKKKKELLKRI